MGICVLLSGVAMRGLLLLLSIAAGCHSMSVYTGSDYTESNCYDKKQAIVHLFEWHWDWIADECWLPGTWRSWQGLQHRPPGWGVLRHNPRLFSKDPDLWRARVFPVTR